MTTPTMPRKSLGTLIARLRDERRTHEISVSTANAEAEHNGLMAQAEGIKRATENKIREVESSA
jgi:hypothetical protein